MGITISPVMMVFLVFMTGFAGFVDSAAGGGGLISLPAYLFAGLPPHYTYATNKFSAACGTTFATASFFKNGAMNVKVGILAAIGSFAGSALGAHIVLLLSDEVLKTTMFIILPIAAVIILWQRNLPDENRDDGTMNLKKAALALGIGLGIGLYDGLVGPGTGTFAIIAFSSLMKFDLRTANGNGKVLNLASNYASLFTYLMSGLVVFSIGIPCAISGIAGNLLAETVCKVFHITDPIAKGVGIGTSAHAVGTSKALQMGEVEGAMSGLSIAVAGVLTAVLCPVFVNFIN